VIYDRPKTDFKEPKLWDASKYNGVCDMCGKEYRQGSPIWAWNGMYFCGGHSKVEIIENMREEEAPAPAQFSPAAPLPSVPSPSLPDPSTSAIALMSYEVRSVLRDGHMLEGKTNVLLGHIDETLAHIDHAIIEQNEELRKQTMLLSILVEQGKK
jgi:hypothetical protein